MCGLVRRALVIATQGRDRSGARRTPCRLDRNVWWDLGSPGWSASAAGWGPQGASERWILPRFEGNRLDAYGANTSSSTPDEFRMSDSASRRNPWFSSLAA